MTRRIPLILTTTLLLGACGPAPIGQNPTPAPTQLSSDIRPGTKGQRLEFVEGEMEIPSGTSSYAIQSANAAQMAQAGGKQLMNLLIPPALAEEEAEDAAEPGDEPISDEQIEKLTATIDGEKVTLEIKSILDLEDGGKLVAYTLRNVPTTEANAIIEFSSPSGSFKLKGVLPKIAVGLRKLADRFNLETTALAEAILANPEKPRHLTAEEIHRLAKTDEVQKLRDKIYTHLVESGEHPGRFDDLVRTDVKALLPGSALEVFLKNHENCHRRGPQCAAKPALPPEKPHPIPDAIQALIRHRQEIRLRLIAGLLTPTATHPATLEERAKLLQMLPVTRRFACITRHISPCPGID